MATPKNYNFSLGGSEFDVSVDSSNASVNGASIKSATDGKFTFAGGSLVSLDQDEFQFVANGGHGEFKFDAAGANNSEIVALDFSKAYAAVSFAQTSGDKVDSIVGSNYADKVSLGDTATYVDLGAGNDYVSLGSGKASVTLGAGADTVDVENAGADAVVTDYKFTENDVVANATLNTADAEFVSMVSGNASLKVGGATVIVAEDDNNVYAMKMKVGTGVSLDANYYLGQKDKDVVLDLSAVKASTTVNFASVKSAEVVMGRGVDSLTLNGKGNNLVTLTANTSSVADVIDSLTSSDALTLTGADVSKITLTGSSNDTVAFAYGKNVNVSLNNVTAKDNGVYALNLNGTVVNYNVMGANNASVMAVAADEAAYSANGIDTVVVDDTAKLGNEAGVRFNNVHAVSLAAADARFVTLTGVSNSSIGNSLMAADNTEGVVFWTYNSKDGDFVDMSKGQDTLWFTSKDGKDSVKGFALGTEETSDILYLADTASAKDIVLKEGVLKIAKAELTGYGYTQNAIAPATANEIMQVMLSDGKISKIAGDFDANSKVQVSLDATSSYDFYALNGKDNMIEATASDEVTFVVNSTVTDAYTTGTKIASVSTANISNTDSKVTVAAVANVTVGAGTNDVWVYGVAKTGNVVLDASNNGTDTIWYNTGIDKNVNVTNFGSEDTVYLVGATDLKSVTDTYKLTTDSTNLLTAAGANGKLILQGTAADVNVKTETGNFVITSNDEFSTDKNIYITDKSDATLNIGGSDDVAIRMGKNSKGVDSSATYSVSDNYRTLDASASTGNLILAGSSDYKSTIIGGAGINQMYGGGSTRDTLIGNAAAQNTFYFGTGDGKDTALNVGVNDTIALWNVASTDIANVVVDVAKGTVTIGKDVLVLQADFENLASVTYTDASGVEYNYDADTKKLTPKTIA
ncbi:MAG: hypothetical protein MSA77_05425 [Selenomonadales bacterium]|nr:hypothetical protein [Selenomonadales bacterium]